MSSWGFRQTSNYTIMDNSFLYFLDGTFKVACSISYGYVMWNSGFHLIFMTPLSVLFLPFHIREEIFRLSWQRIGKIWWRNCKNGKRTETIKFLKKTKLFLTAKEENFTVCNRICWRHLLSPQVIPSSSSTEKDPGNLSLFYMILGLCSQLTWLFGLSWEFGISIQE